MRNVNTFISKARKIEIASPYSYYNMHQSSGLVLTDRAPAAQQLMGDITIVGTETVVDATVDTTDTSTTCTMDDTSVIKAGMGMSGAGIPSGAAVSSITNGTTFELDMAATATASNITATFSIWGDGKLVPQGDHEQRDATASEACRLDTLNTQLIIAFDIYGTAAPSTAASEALFYFGRNNAGYGAWGLAFLGNNNGRLQLVHYSAVDGAQTGAQNSDASLFDSTTHNVFIIIDPTTLVGRLFVDGAEQGSGASLGSAVALAKADIVRGLSIFCKSTTDAGGYVQQLGANSAGLQTDELFMLRSSTDISSDAEMLALAWHNKPSRELPSEFHGI